MFRHESGKPYQGPLIRSAVASAWPESPFRGNRVALVACSAGAVHPHENGAAVEAFVPRVAFGNRESDAGPGCAVTSRGDDRPVYGAPQKMSCFGCTS